MPDVLLQRIYDAGERLEVALEESDFDAALEAARDRAHLVDALPQPDGAMPSSLSAALAAQHDRLKGLLDTSHGALTREEAALREEREEMQRAQRAESAYTPPPSEAPRFHDRMG